MIVSNKQIMTLFKRKNMIQGVSVLLENKKGQPVRVSYQIRKH